MSDQGVLCHLPVLTPLVTLYGLTELFPLNLPSKYTEVERELAWTHRTEIGE